MTAGATVPIGSGNLNFAKLPCNLGKSKEPFSMDTIVIGEENAH